jgi:tetratricopeptide (TPR) repeat protein
VFAPLIRAEVTRSDEGFEANERGVEYMEQGKMKQAVKAFEKAFEIDGSSRVIRKNLTLAYNNYAVNLMGEGRDREAREYLERALRLVPEDSVVKENLGRLYRKAGVQASFSFPGRVGASPETKKAFGKIANDFLMQGIQYFEKKEYDLAKEALQESLRYADNNATAYELLGDITYFEQDLARAKEYYARAYRIQRSTALEQKIEKLGREVTIETKLDAYEDEHFIIRYKEDIQQLFGGGFEIREYLREAYRAISQDFAFYPREKVVILLYEEAEYRQLSQTPAWTAGHYDGKVRLPAYKQAVNVQEIKKLIWHELTHFFIQRLSRGGCPLWLNEGLAQVEENKVKRIDLGYFRAALTGKYLLSMEELEKGYGEDAGATDVFLFYQQSYAVTDHLVKKYRMFKVKEMLAAFGRGKTADQVFEEILGISRGAFEIKWLASLKT